MDINPRTPGSLIELAGALGTDVHGAAGILGIVGTYIVVGAGAGVGKTGAGILAPAGILICQGVSGGGNGGRCPVMFICGNGYAICGYICVFGPIMVGAGGIIGITGCCIG